MTIGAGIGLAALLVALVGAFVPVIGLIIGWVALALAALAALCGDKGFAIATIIVSGAVFLFLTPSLWLDTAVGNHNPTGNGYLMLTTSIALLAAPIIAMFLYSSGKLMLAKKIDQTDI